MPIDASIPLAGVSPNVDIGGAYQTAQKIDANKLVQAQKQIEIMSGLLGQVKDPETYQQARMIAIQNGLATPEQIPEEYNPRQIEAWKNATMSAADKLNLEARKAEIAIKLAGGPTGILADRFGRDPEFAKNFYATQTGNRQGMQIDPMTREVMPMPGAADTKGMLARGEESGKQQAKLDYAAPIEAAKQEGKGEISERDKLQAGKKKLTGTTSKLRALYSELDKAKAAVSTERSALENIGAYTRGSAVGQAAGRAAGTKEQSIRNQIKMQLPSLVNSIRSATGMSAKSMDSNTELQFYLKMATDPQADIEANMAALDAIEELYGTGDVSAPATPQRPSLDEIFQ